MIASSVGGLPEVVLDGATGWVVPVGNPKVLADTIEIVLDNPQEARKRARMDNFWFAICLMLNEQGMKFRPFIKTC